MTEEQVYIVDELKQKVLLLVERLKNQKKVNLDLSVIKNELELRLKQQQVEIENLKKENNTLRLSKAFIAENGETEEARTQINKIVREIDKCIALLNR